MRQLLEQSSYADFFSPRARTRTCALAERNRRPAKINEKVRTRRRVKVKVRIIIRRLQIIPTRSDMFVESYLCYHAVRAIDHRTGHNTEADMSIFFFLFESPVIDTDRDYTARAGVLINIFRAFHPVIVRIPCVPPSRRSLIWRFQRGASA